MASSAQRSRKTSAAQSGRGRSQNTTKAKQPAAVTPEESAIKNEIVLIGVFALTVLLFLCNFGVIGVVGDAVSRVMFGIFGLTAYAVPVLAFIAIAFGISNQGNRIAIMKLTAGVVLFFVLGIVFELIGYSGTMEEAYSIKNLYETCGTDKAGGGVAAGSLAWVLHHFLGMVGTVLLLLVLAIICLVVITEKSLVGGVKSSGRRVYETAVSDVQVRRERRVESQARRQEEAVRRREESRNRKEEAAARKQERARLKEEAAAREEAERILRMDRKVSGVMLDTSLKESANKQKSRDDIHEITLETPTPEKVEVHEVTPMGEPENSFDEIRIHTMSQQPDEPEHLRAEEREEDAFWGRPFETEELPSDIELLQSDLPVSTENIIAQEADVYRDMKEVSPAMVSGRAAAEKKAADIVSFEESRGKERPRAYSAPKPATAAEATAVGQQMAKLEKAAPKAANRPYQFPPISLLHKSGGKSVDSTRELKETAIRLQETLQTFGVRVSITDISQGPAVTRYELQPEQGVKVSKIVGLADDIKLNLAATDIRIEAPIPGKAAIGIEVPNKENTAVGLRELLETKEFKDFPSRIAFAVGKDIAGKAVVSDIAKMPHMLIAGATGSGKSVCINTLIMSILYKANPNEVKLILVDPKVVELSVYNGIPHLLIPVVTDPKKASAALQWGVAEMTDRYKKFADYNVRDLKGFNKKADEMREKGAADAPARMPQIVIIVDELADLMMVAPGEVEESICRLAQLARAAGIHLIIATQRPSVDVITGLIKANMPSRVAFAVSSGVDSRTILDMNGAEKLLGKGDMLFYPQGYSKPVRVQGAFVSDNEVSDVVDFLKNQAIGNIYSEDIEEKLKNFSTGSGGSSSSSGTEYDEHFVEAGKFIIDKNKASIGMLQRVFKIGFNRAARIMDQLAEAGVVGEEEGTKPRKVLMSMDEFEQFVEETI
ncbi:MAG: DNA translocase FtsK [Eubacteriales bacterium]|nr:DNA translocase FtsK [Eubacteriales bacterium]